MGIKITDTDTGQELWTGHQCADHLGVSLSTWRAYCHYGNPPAVHTRFNGKTPLWVADEVKEWHKNRPGSPVPNSPGKRRKA